MATAWFIYTNVTNLSILGMNSQILSVWGSVDIATSLMNMRRELWQVLKFSVNNNQNYILFQSYHMFQKTWTVM